MLNSFLGVLPDIQNHFQINDLEAGLLQTAFIIAYLIFAPIIGYLGDRHNRKAIMIYGMVIWLSAVIGSSIVPDGKQVIS